MPTQAQSKPPKKPIQVRVNGSVCAAERLVLIFVKWKENSAWICITTMIIVIYLLIEKKYISLKLIKKMLNFQLYSI